MVVILSEIELELLRFFYLRADPSRAGLNGCFWQSRRNHEVHRNTLRVTNLLGAKVNADLDFLVGIVLEIKVVDLFIDLILQ